MKARSRRQRRPYWRWTKRQLITHLLFPGLAVLTIPTFFDDLNTYNFLGFPLGYFAAVHGTILFAVLSVLRFVSSQAAVDRWHGQQEEL